MLSSSPDQEITGCGSENSKRDIYEIVLDQFRDLFPVLSEIISQDEESGDPYQAARPRVGHEGGELQAGGAGHQRRKVPQTRDEVSAEQRPVADPVEPALDPLQALFG